VVVDRDLSSFRETFERAFAGSADFDVIREAAAKQPGCAILVVMVCDGEAHVVTTIEAGAGGSPISPMSARLELDRPRAPAAAGAGVALSERETQILGYVAKGFSFADICKLLDITANTVKTHVNRIYRKLAVNSRGQAVYEASRLGLVEL
jgi:DNA-binding NarL/FixJ family response regulator